MKEQILFIFSLILLLTVSLYADEGQWKTYTVADGLVSPDVVAIFQDSIGNLWFGGRNGGVSRFDGRDFRSFTEKNGLPSGYTKQIFEDIQGYLWFTISGPMPGGESRICRYYNGKEFQQITEQDGLTGGFSDAVLKDNNGNLWIANKYGLIKYDGKKFQQIKDDSFQQFISAQDEKEKQIYTIFQSQNGDIWLGGGPRIEYHGGPGRRNQWAAPFVIRYDGSQFEYFSLDFLENFLPSSINSIAEDNYGNLWFGGRFILLKYDGNNFERFDSQTQTTTGEVLPEDIRPGQIILTWKEPLDKTGEPLFSVSSDWDSGPYGRERNNLTTTNTEDGNYRYQHRIAFISIDSIFKDSHGNLWFNNRGFISRWDGKEMRHIVIPNNWEEIKEQIGIEQNDLRDFYPGHIVLEDLEGNLWFRSANGAYRFNGDSFQIFTVDDGLGSDNISVIFEAIDGKFWFGHDNGVTSFDPEPPIIQNFTTRGALGSNSVHFINEDEQGLVWFSVRGGVVRYDGKKLQYFSGLQMGDWHNEPKNIQFPLDTNFAVNILDDKKDNVWFVGHETHQLFRYKNGVFRRYTVWHDNTRHINHPYRFGAFDNQIVTVDLEGNLWLAVENLPIRCNGENFEILTEKGFQKIAQLRRNNIDRRERFRAGITDIHVDSKGNIWFGTFGEGVKRYDGVSFKTFTTADGLKSNNVIKIFEDRLANLWFAGEKALTQYNGKSFQNFSISDVTGVPIVIYQDIHDVISFLYPDTLVRYDGEDLEFLKLDEMLGVLLDERMVRASTVDSQGNLWLATSHGAIKYDGKQFINYTTEDGLLINDIRDIVEDSQGNIWCATWGGGVALYNGEKFQAITTKDGLIHNNIRKVFEDSKGNMWFATDGGITKYTLRKGILPRIKLTKIIADDVYTDFDEELELPANVKNLTFHYQGFSLKKMNLFYTYKLEGYDTDWSEPRTQNLVEYKNLEPGTYKFLVKALRSPPSYSNPPAFAKFTITPPFWKQLKFYLPISLGILTLSAFAFLLTRFVIQRRQAEALRIELRQKRRAEAQRVFQELNDAREIQMGLLPKAAPNIDEFEIAGISLPATEVGGDFFDYLELKDNHVGIALADVSGKGLRAAMNAVLTNGMLREIVQFEPKVEAILSRLNNDLRPLLYGSMFTALNFSALNLQTKQMQYTNAGQPYPIIKRNGDVYEIDLGGPPLGGIENVKYKQRIVDLYTGDYVIFYSDGITEAMNKSKEIYGFDRLKKTICNLMIGLSAEDMIQRILQDVQAFVDEAEQYDDMTLVVLRCI